MSTALSATEGKEKLMASTPVPAREELSPDTPQEGGSTAFIRVIVADSQAIFRAGLRKIFALEDDIRVVGQAETYPQSVSAVQKFSCDIVIFEAALAENASDAVGEMLRHAPSCRLV